jgi:hypothetical protein
MSKDPRLEQVTPHSTVEKLLANAKDREKKEELSKEEMKDFRRAVNAVMSTKNGKLFWKMSKRVMKIDMIDHDYNPINMAVSKAYRNYYNFILNMLSEDVRIELGREGS